MGKEKPILMSGDSVRRMRHKGKVATTRVVVPQPTMPSDPALAATVYPDWYDRGPEMAFWLPDGRMTEQRTWRPAYAVGDTLWVREAWRTYRDLDAVAPRDIYPPTWVHYEADGGWPGGATGKYRPGMFMPKWMCRMRRTMERVTMRRLSDMTEADAVLEGCDSLAEYKVIWDDLNAKRGYGWEVNPFVWFYEFSGEEAGS